MSLVTRGHGPGLKMVTLGLGPFGLQLGIFPEQVFDFVLQICLSRTFTLCE